MILVTGATGIVGTQILKQLVAQNQAVKALKRSNSDTSWTTAINHKIHWIEADILDLLALDKAFEGVSRVIHCAAVISFDNRNDAHMQHVNIEGTKNVLDLAQKHNIKKLVHISSVAALGRKTDHQEITEQAQWEASPLNTAYATSKYLAELEVWRAQEEGLPTIILNPSVIIGPGNWNSSSTQLFTHVKKGNPMYPTGSVNYVDVRDVARIAIIMANHTVQGQRFILNAGMVSYQHLFQLIAQAMNKKPPQLKVSPKLAIFVASILRVVTLFTGIKTNITREAVLLSRLTIVFSSRKVAQLLNYTFTPLQDSVAWTCQQLENKK